MSVNFQHWPSAGSSWERHPCARARRTRPRGYRRGAGRVRKWVKPEVDFELWADRVWDARPEARFAVRFKAWKTSSWNPEFVQVPLRLAHCRLHVSITLALLYYSITPKRTERCGDIDT